MGFLEGILCIDKPGGFTSFDVIAKLRGITRTKKIGHAGTLDPMATGVLPVFFGRAAKAVDLILNHDKTYIASIKLGITTDTQDTTGQILSRRDFGVARAEFERALAGFEGQQEQIPPMYSAVKVNGRRLYDIARSGGEIERRPREVNFYSLNLLEADEASGCYTFEAVCSRGTYIRTLCHDLGEKLGCGAAMSALRRTEACGFSISDCVTLGEAQRLMNENALEARLLPVADVFADCERLYLNEKQERHFLNGLELGLSQFERAFRDGARIGVYNSGDTFLGLAAADVAAKKLAIIKLFALGDVK